MMMIIVSSSVGQSKMKTFAFFQQHNLKYTNRLMKLEMFGSYQTFQLILKQCYEMLNTLKAFRTITLEISLKLDVKDF